MKSFLYSAIVILTTACTSVVEPVARVESDNERRAAICADQYNGEWKIVRIGYNDVYGNTLWKEEYRCVVQVSPTQVIYHTIP